MVFRRRQPAVETVYCICLLYTSSSGGDGVSRLSGHLCRAPVVVLSLRQQSSLFPVLSESVLALRWASATQLLSQTDQFQSTQSVYTLWPPELLLAYLTPGLSGLSFQWLSAFPWKLPSEKNQVLYPAVELFYLRQGGYVFIGVS